ncbi:hypothetical protein ACFY2W_21010 [Streptomyces sp. NPDC001262]|uniref:hypothetical protein n=1 Tax=unclassified Streptomyces TaxID=2593676 RepID=UPI0036805C1E
MSRFCSWCKESAHRATVIDVVEGDHVARKIYACAECCEKYRLVPLNKSSRATSTEALGPVQAGPDAWKR